jgi:hypothetical protein
VNSQIFKANLDIHAVDKGLSEISAEKETLLHLRKQLLQQQSSPSNSQLREKIFTVEARELGKFWQPATLF